MITGVVEADSEQNAVELLWRSGLTIIDLKKKVKLPPIHELLPSLYGVKRRDVIQFSRNMASLLDAGIPILRALNIQSRFGGRAFRAVLRSVAQDLEGGSRLSEALAKHPLVFPTFYVHLVKTGEEVGNLAGVLKELVTHMERDEETARKVRGALMYPAFLILMAIGVIFIMLTFVVPALMDLFSELGSDLPAITRMMISISDFFVAYWLYMIAGVVGLAVVWWLYSRTPAGKRTKDRIILRIPLISTATLKGSLARFARNLGMLVGAGVSLFEALKLIADTTDNTVVAEAVANVRQGVADGQLLSQAVIAEPVFPSLMGEMIGVGEETGALEGHLLKIASFYEEEADRAVQRVTGMLTPALTIGVGLLVGFVAVVQFSSIYSIAKAFPE
jgi:type IV pilus assembly protein PilC